MDEEMLGAEATPGQQQQQQRQLQLSAEEEESMGRLALEMVRLRYGFSETFPVCKILQEEDNHETEFAVHYVCKYNSIVDLVRYGGDSDHRGGGSRRLLPNHLPRMRAFLRRFDEHKNKMASDFVTGRIASLPLVEYDAESRPQIRIVPEDNEGWWETPWPSSSPTGADGEAELQRRIEGERVREAIANNIPTFNERCRGSNPFFSPADEAGGPADVNLSAHHIIPDCEIRKFLRRYLEIELEAIESRVGRSTRRADREATFRARFCRSRCTILVVMRLKHFAQLLDDCSVSVKAVSKSLSDFLKLESDSSWSGSRDFCNDLMARILSYNFGNIFFGPRPQERSDDPRGQFEERCEPIIGPERYREMRALYDDMRSFNGSCRRPSFGSGGDATPSDARLLFVRFLVAMQEHSTVPFDREQWVRDSATDMWRIAGRDSSHSNRERIQDAVEGVAKSSKGAPNVTPARFAKIKAMVASIPSSKPMFQTLFSSYQPKRLPENQNAVTTNDAERAYSTLDELEPAHIRPRRIEDIVPVFKETIIQTEANESALRIFLLENELLDDITEPFDDN